MKTFASLFTGFDGAGIGAQATGLTLSWGIEYRADIAEVANANLGGHVLVADILKCDSRRFERVDVLHASPPCPNFSVAKKDRGETEHDLALAQKVADFVKTLLPTVFTLENVIAYRKSQSWQLIEDQLFQAGYWVHVDNLNAADFGVPQTRRRMIVRAVRGGIPSPLPLPVPWIGWHAAIADILDTLPESRFASWQLARLPDRIDGTFLSVQQQSDDKKGTEFGYGTPRRSPTQPAFTVTTQAPGWYKAFLLTGQYGQPNSITERSAQNIPGDAPSPTVTGSVKGDWRAWLSTGRVVAMTPRALARFQTFPDWYDLPANRRLASLGIGNAVPPLLYQRIAESLSR